MVPRNRHNSSTARVGILHTCTWFVWAVRIRVLRAAWLSVSVVNIAVPCVIMFAIQRYPTRYEYARAVCGCHLQQRMQVIPSRHRVHNAMISPLSSCSGSKRPLIIPGRRYWHALSPAFLMHASPRRLEDISGEAHVLAGRAPLGPREVTNPGSLPRRGRLPRPRRPRAVQSACLSDECLAPSFGRHLARQATTITGGHGEYDPMLSAKIAKYIGFCVYHRSYLLWSPVIM